MKPQTGDINVLEKTQAFAEAVAHATLADLLKQGLEVPSKELVAVAIAHLNVMVTVTIRPHKNQSPADQKAMNGTTRQRPRLTTAQKKVLAELHLNTPVKAQVLAMRLGLPYAGSFRARLADLTRFGVVRHVRRIGYFLVHPDHWGEMTIVE